MLSHLPFALLLGAALLAPIPGAKTDPGSPPLAARSDPDYSDRSYYLPMRDGTRLALNLYFPGHALPAKPAPVVLIQTRYGRAKEFIHATQRDPRHWVEAGYVVAVADTRGSTSSYGPRDVDIGPDEVRDMDELIAHLAKQPWSNGQVIATGFSYMADTADWASSRHAPSLIAAIPRETDFDVYLDLFVPGGVSNDLFLKEWGDYTFALDTGRIVTPKATLDCLARVEDCAKLFPVLQPVDADADYNQLRKALSQRRRWRWQDYERAEFRDDRTASGHSLFASSPASALAGIRRERKPTLYWGSWMDGGTAAAALARYASAPEVPMEVWITANNHGHTVGADPFQFDVLAPFPSQDAQFEVLKAFAARVRAGERMARSIHYDVLGTNRFDVSASWPPPDTTPVTLHVAAGRRLQRQSGGVGSDRYAVDFSATTGPATRWSTQVGPVAPHYPDRREEDAKLLHYDAEPVDADMEVAGTPVLSLNLSSATADPAIFAYLEDVAPDGRVTYLTEGTFRAVNRKPAAPGTLPYDQGPASHSFNRADARPMTPGKAETVRFALFPVAALIRKGHHLRLAIAGADAGAFRRYSEGKPEVFQVGFGGADGSALTLDMRAAKPPA